MRELATGLIPHSSPLRQIVCAYACMYLRKICNWQQAFPRINSVNVTIYLESQEHYPRSQ
jgi:hypothetical protein